ncbi:L-glutamate gamma-semialdehyde dehydrogenase [Streptomyces rectiviolaceus]|uniref:L-glutamate gamma-semialdehyde dehydrogenase n=1 Tax=Streptomyces rectiviolaceus TaxID=332591 RepID=A0ABP6MDP4_9ACTN
MDAVTQVPAPVNEPVHGYAPGSPERARLETKLKELSENPIELPMTIGGVKRLGGGEPFQVVQPHNHKAVIGNGRGATQQDAQDAIDAALAAAPAWRAMSFDNRAAIILRAAELLSTTWRETLAASTMLGQSKTAQQAEIDTPCELIDFWRFNVKYARDLLAEQPPANSTGVWNRLDHRPLEGFVYAITPFNFTAIAGNLPTAPALMGNVVVWKPSPTQTHAAVLLMQLLEEAGLPKGVINLVTGDGKAVSDVALTHRDLAGIHFTGSTPTFQHLWKTVGENIANYRTYPRLVGETGGKDFVVAHPSADRAVLKTALTRGSFEFQGQKCSASSRAYVPASIWNSGFKEEFAAEVDGIKMGDVTDLSNFIGAVIDERAFAKNKAAIDRAAADPTCTIVAGGTYDDSVGYFVRPTVVECSDPANEVFTTEYFGPFLAIHVYEDDKYDEMLAQMESASDYALTGSVISGDRAAAAYTMDKLRYAAGNFYINDKSTGAVVGQQPFGGGRSSGTNDKAGAPQNLQRWTLTRAIKETLVSPTDYSYPHMG